MKILLLILIFNTFWVFKCFAQRLGTEDVKVKAENYANNLIKDFQTERVLIYIDGCIGCDSSSDQDCFCFAEHGAHVFWEKDSITFMTYMDCCSSYNKEKLTRFDLWKELNQKKEEVFSSKFKTNVFVDHYIFENLILITQNSSHEIEMPSYYFNKENKYWRKNSKLPAKKFVENLKLNVFNFKN